jgi:imidazoleglycerol phosphate synthase cyclase subunit
MLTRRIVPCLDVRDGRVVKGVQFQGLRDAGDPAERAALYDAQGADELVILDVSATPDGRATAVETVRRVRAVLRIPQTVGGGVRKVENAGALLDAGADKVACNTAAVENPALLTEIATRFGRQCAILALDAARRPPEADDAPPTWEVVTMSGRQRTGRDVVAWAREAVERGAGEIVLTSWDRDGTGLGYDLELLRAVSEAVRVPIVASGGAASPEHLSTALQAGADAVLAASIFHDGQYTVSQVKAHLAALGHAVRPTEANAP